METQFNSIFNVIGALGGYFAVVLVLALVVETVIDMVKMNKTLAKWAGGADWLQFLDVQRKHISPDKVMRDVAAWVPLKSQADVQVATLNNLLNTFDTTLTETTGLAEEAGSAVRDLIAMTGLSEIAAENRIKLAQKMVSVRNQYDESESVRIMRMRRLATGLGILIAGGLGMDTFALITPMLSESMRGWVDTPFMSMAGMVLTGIAASAGSSFWHDQLDRVRAVKQSARNLQSVLNQ